MARKKKHPVAFICSNARSANAIGETARQLTLDGYIVLTTSVLGQRDSALDDDDKMRLLLMNLDKIDMADLVCVVNDCPVIDSVMMTEICYAHALGKEVDVRSSLRPHDVNHARYGLTKRAEQLAWESLEELKHRHFPDGIEPDPLRNPSIVKDGFEYFDPWITKEAQWDAWSTHGDPNQTQDPFEVFGRERMARFVAEVLIGRFRR